MYTFILMIIFVFQGYLFLQWDNLEHRLKSFTSKDYVTILMNEFYKLKSNEEWINPVLMRVLERYGEVLFSDGNQKFNAQILKTAISSGLTATPVSHEKTINELRETKREGLEPRITPKPKEEPKIIPESPLREVARETIPPVEEMEPVASLVSGVMIPFWVLIVILVGVVLFAIVFTYSITTILVRKTVGVSRTEEIKKYQEIILQMLQEKQMLTQEEQKVIVTLPATNDVYNEVVVISPVARKRAKRIEIIEQVLKNEKRPEIAEQLIGPFLFDPDNRVRANAAKAMYRHNKNLALETLRDMINSSNKWMIISACWVFEQIKDLEGLKLVTEFLNNPDKHIKYRALKAVEAIISSHTPQEIEKIKKELPKDIEISFAE